MNTTLKRFVALLCAAVLGTTVLTSCRGNKVSTESTDSGYYEDESNLTGDSSLTGSDAQTGNSSNDSTSVTPGTPSTPGTPGTDNPGNYRGTTVRYATWKDPAANEDGIVIKSFKEKYGITVKIDMINQSDYIQTIASRIASGNAPDIVFDNNEFPASLAVLQPLSTANIDLTDPIWDQEFIKQATINGNTYEVNTVSNIWSEVDCVFYNKKLFSAKGLTTPEQYYAHGNWTWDTFEKVLRDFKAQYPSNDYYGGVIGNQQIMLASLDTGFFRYKNGSIYTSVDDPTLLKAITRMSTWYKNHLINGGDGIDFGNNKAGMYVTNAFGLKKTGYFSDMNADSIGFTFLPSSDANTTAKPSALWRGWGICKGATNPVGAGIFLRYYLDVNNYDTSSAFINSAAETFFFKLTSTSTTEKEFYLSQGITHITGEVNDGNYTVLYQRYDPNQIQQQLSTLTNLVNASVKKANATIQNASK